MPKIVYKVAGAMSLVSFTFAMSIGAIQAFGSLPIHTIEQQELLIDEAWFSPFELPDVFFTKIIGGPQCP